ncbi:MAG: ferrous iron transport protein B [Thermoplasmata archaeon]|nr:ferrous iron transport protein B [Euryarchaeota archaeon]MVT14581.1 ferrous iron transport protein B [Euryarchaeota archaeon]
MIDLNVRPKRLKIALIGNLNVGKSVIFNFLTRKHQKVANWPGKTVEVARGEFFYLNREIEIVDLPGIYSLSTFSPEEEVTRDFLLKENPDAIINVVDASILERNLYLTLQILEMGIPTVIALNQVDQARKKGIEINRDILENRLGVYVVETVAIYGKGIDDLIKKAIESAEKRKIPNVQRFPEEIEKRILEIENYIKEERYSKRWYAIKLLENDPIIVKIFMDDEELLKKVKRYREEIERIYGENIYHIFSHERYKQVGDILEGVQKFTLPTKAKLTEVLENITVHRYFGYIFLVLSILAIYGIVFFIGSYIASFFDFIFESIGNWYFGSFGHTEFTGLLWDGLVEGGIGAALQIVFSYIFPLFIMLTILEDSGYLPRMAYLMDSFMVKMGVNGKAFLPIMLGFGCNVPACISCKILENKKERLIASFLASLVPCSARTVVILGVVGYFLGIQYALLLYVLDFIIIFIAGKISSLFFKEKTYGMILEIPSFKRPMLKSVIKESWYRVKSFFSVALPVIVAGSFIIALLNIYGILNIINNALEPITVYWLGLPAITGFLLIFGFLRKEMTVIMLAAFLGTTNFASVLTPAQMFVFAFVVMIYVPCVATVAALIKYSGWKAAALISLGEVFMAILLGGILYRIIILI